MHIIRLQVDDILELKKPDSEESMLRCVHPCGTNTMRVARVGSDVRIICLGCGRDMTLPREKLEKVIRSVESKK